MIRCQTLYQFEWLFHILTQNSSEINFAGWIPVCIFPRILACCCSARGWYLWSGSCLRSTASACVKLAMVPTRCVLKVSTNNSNRIRSLISSESLYWSIFACALFWWRWGHLTTGVRQGCTFVFLDLLLPDTSRLHQVYLAQPSEVILMFGQPWFLVGMIVTWLEVQCLSWLLCIMNEFLVSDLQRCAAMALDVLVQELGSVCQKLDVDLQCSIR